MRCGSLTGECAGEGMLALREQRMARTTGKAKGNTSNQMVSYRLLLGENEFEKLVEAIASLSIAARKLQTLRNVAEYAIEKYALSDLRMLSKQLDPEPIDAEITVHIKLERQTAERLERLRLKLQKVVKRPCEIREALIMCALLTARPSFSACNMIQKQGTL
jgi:hypothetical protein